MLLVVTKLHVQLMHWQAPADNEETIDQWHALFAQITSNLVHSYALYGFNMSAETDFLTSFLDGAI